MSSRRRRERKGATAARTPERLIANIREAIGARQVAGGAAPRCFVCGDPRIAVGGVWCPSPEVQAKLLIPSSKYRMIVYGACRKCARLPDLAARAEAAILADFAELAASPERN